MYMVNIIENNARESRVSHFQIPVDDDAIVEAAADYHSQEMKCINNGLLLAYTLWIEYFETFVPSHNVLDVKP